MARACAGSPSRATTTRPRSGARAATSSPSPRATSGRCSTSSSSRPSRGRSIGSRRTRGGRTRSPPGRRTGGSSRSAATARAWRSSSSPTRRATARRRSPAAWASSPRPPGALSPSERRAGHGRALGDDRRRDEHRAPARGGAARRGARAAARARRDHEARARRRRGRAPRGRASLQVGAVRLTERHVRGDPPSADEVQALRSAAREAVRPLAAMAGRPAGGRLVGVAGTVTTLSAVAQALPAYDAEWVHGAALALAEVERLAGTLAALTVRERAALRGMEPKRADVILAGALVVAEAMRALGFDRLTVSDRGVRWGLLYDRLEHV